jgi:hypothetical protein
MEDILRHLMWVNRELRRFDLVGDEDNPIQRDAIVRDEMNFLLQSFVWKLTSTQS